MLGDCSTQWGDLRVKGPDWKPGFWAKTAVLPLFPINWRRPFCKKPLLIYEINLQYASSIECELRVDFEKLQGFLCCKISGRTWTVGRFRKIARFFAKCLAPINLKQREYYVYVSAAMAERISITMI